MAIAGATIPQTPLALNPAEMIHCGGVCNERGTVLMLDKTEGFLEVGLNEQGEIVVNHPALKADENGIGHIVFSPNQARHLAGLLDKHAREAENEILRKESEARRKVELAKRTAAEAIPVDRSDQTLADGSPVTDDHRELKPNGQQKDYVVLSAEERAKGFVRPVRRSYRHKTCGGVTTMPGAIAETYARGPGFYSGTFCCNCGKHYPLIQFEWTGTTEQVGS